VEKLDRRMVARQADVRDLAALRAAVDAGITELGGLDIAVANAGIARVVAPSWELTDEQWRTMLEVNLTGVWRTTTASFPRTGSASTPSIPPTS